MTPRPVRVAARRMTTSRRTSSPARAIRATTGPLDFWLSGRRSFGCSAFAHPMTSQLRKCASPPAQLVPGLVSNLVDPVGLRVAQVVGYVGPNGLLHVKYALRVSPRIRPEAAFARARDPSA